MHVGSAVAVAAVFVWIGMILAISVVEAPLKFRAPGVTLPIGLGIGRLVFRALNACEAVLAAATVIGFVIATPNAATVTAFAIAAVALLVQIVAVRPALSRRSDAVLAGEDGPRSHAHLWYVALEIVMVIALIATGVLLLAR
jgi:hypothetical protein